MNEEQEIMNAQGAAQDAQEGAVTAETTEGEPTATPAEETPQEAPEAPEGDTQEGPAEEAPADAPQEPQENPEGDAQEAPAEEAPADAPQEPQGNPQGDAQEGAVATETTEGEPITAHTEETPQEAPEAPEEGTQEAPAAETPQEAPAAAGTTALLGGVRPTLGGTVSPAVITPTPVLMTAGSNAQADTEEETDEEYETLTVNSLDTVKLGRQGEHLTQQVVIDCSVWLDKLPGCTLLIAAIRPGENTVYLPTVSVEDGVITWDIEDQDTARGGWGRGEVRAMLDGKIKKSAVFRTRVEPSLEGSGTAPATPPDWVQEILDSVAAAQAAAEAAAASAVEAAENTRGLAGWSLAKEENGTVTIDYTESEE